MSSSEGKTLRFITSSAVLVLPNAYFHVILHSLLQLARVKDSDNEIPKFESH